MSYLQLIREHGRFLAFGFALTLFSSFGQTFFIALFSDDIRAAFDLTHGGFGACYSAATLASGFTLIWLGQKLDTVDLRLFTTGICCGLALAALGMATASIVWVLAIAIYMMRLFGQGLLSHTGQTSMARYLDAGRGKAMSIAGLGFAGGEAVFPIAAVIAIEAFGWRQTWAMIAALMIGMVLPLALWLLRGHGERHRQHVERLSMELHNESEHRLKSQRRQWTRREVLRDPRFYLMLPAITAPPFIVTGLFFHQLHLIETKGWTAQWFASCFIVFAAAQLPAGIGAGPLVDRFTGRRLMPLFVLPMFVALVVLTLGRHMAFAALFMALLGVTAGVVGPVVGSMWPEVYGVRSLGAIRAMAQSIMVFATAGSPVLMGALIDAGVSMEAITGAGAAYTVLAALLAWVALRERSDSSSLQN